MESYHLINNKKPFNFLNKNKEQNKTYYFPSLTHKELLSIIDLKHQIYCNSRTKKQNNTFLNFHTEVLKTNFKDNPKYISLYKNISKRGGSEIKYPDIQKEKIFKNDKIVKLYNNSNTLSIYNNSKINKNIINYNIIKYNKTTNKFNMSNISTSGNISLSINSKQLFKLNKIDSNSADLNDNSYINLNINKYNNNSTLNNNSFEQRLKTYNSNNTSSSINKNNKFNTYAKKDNLLLTKSISNLSGTDDNVYMKFISNLNPTYTLLKKEFLSEFKRKTKDISYLKFFFMKKQLDIDSEKEKRISEIEKQSLTNYNINMIYYYFNKYNDSKLEYLNYLKKTITHEREKNKKLKEDKINIVNEIFMIRHKTLRLENRFRNYLNDKYLLLSVKNHSFTINKFTQEDQKDYNKDLKKLEILNNIIKVTERENHNKYNESNKNNLSKSNSKRKIQLTNINNRKPSSNNLKSPIKSFMRQNTKILANNYYSLYGTKSGSIKPIIKANFRAMPIYDDPDDFKRDLQETTNKIQFSLVDYNEISKEIQMMRNQLYQDTIKMKNIEKYKNFIKEEIIIYNKNLDNLRTLNNNLNNYIQYLLNIKILNLNKGKVNLKINKIIKTINESKDEILLDYLSNSQGGTTLQNLSYIEKALIFLLKYKEIQKNNNNMKYLSIQSKIEDKNRIKYSKFKQDKIQKKYHSLINKVINKNKKIIFVSRRKVNMGFNPELNIKKSHKINLNRNNYFGDFDLD